jgi:hypothetical protein
MVEPDRSARPAVLRSPRSRSTVTIRARDDTPHGASVLLAVLMNA